MATDYKMESQNLWNRLRLVETLLGKGSISDQQANWETEKIFHDLQYVRSINPVLFSVPKPYDYLEIYDINANHDKRYDID